MPRALLKILTLACPDQHSSQLSGSVAFPILESLLKVPARLSMALAKLRQVLTLAVASSRPFLEQVLPLTTLAVSYTHLTLPTKA